MLQPGQDHLEVRSERVWQPHVAWEGRENQVPHLDTVGRDDIAEGEVVVTQEFWEVMQQHQQNTESALGRETSVLGAQ